MPRTAQWTVSRRSPLRGGYRAPEGAFAGAMRRSRRALTACAILAAILWSDTARADDEVIERVLSLVAQERYSDARAVLAPLLEREPEAPRVWLMHGILRAREGNAGEAIAIFESLRIDRPDMFEPHNNLAVLYAEQGRLDAAREALLAALERKSDAVAYANLGDVYMRLADRAYARAREVGTASVRPVTAEAVEAPAPAACVRAGRFRDAAAAVEAAAWIRSRDAEVVRVRQEEHQTVGHYRVYLPAFPSHKEAAEKVRELRGRGIRDVAIVGKGARANEISLGVYKVRSNMRRRVAVLEKLGYPVKSRANTKTGREYAVEARIVGDRSAFDAAWTSKFPGHPVRTVACP